MYAIRSYYVPAVREQLLIYAGAANDEDVLISYTLQPLLNEIARTRICLLNADSKAAYEKRLRAQLAAAQKSQSNLSYNFV